MENASHALYMVLAIAAFVLAWTYSLYLIGVLNTTTETLVYRLDETNYYDSLSLTDLIAGEDGESNAYKVVGVESIIPTLYRYYDESYCVKIVDKSGNLCQIFDTTIEGEVSAAVKLPFAQRDSRQKALTKLYDDREDSFDLYLFGAPWIGDTNNAKERVDAYISGKKIYINGTLVDYTNNTGNKKNNLKSVGSTFKEIFTQYAYQGDTITSEDEDITLTGSAETLNKIVITYQAID